MKLYNEFNSVDELREYYNLKPNNIVLEKKNDVDKIDVDDIKKASRVINKDDVDVFYADLKKTCTNIFKHIIIFTNNNDPKDNKTLKNILDAVENLKKAKCEIIPELHVFVAAEVDVDDDNDTITICDGDEKMVIEKENNTDTLVLARLGVQNEGVCEHIVQILQDRGFLVLNPVRYTALACNKYDSAVLFKKGNIPQPRFALISKDILYDEKLYNKSLKDIYPEWDPKDSDKNENLSFVVKILDGHGGTGVCMMNGKHLYSILQMVFAIDPECELLLQKKEEADGGDIRVHVLTLRDKQIILGAMKRIKLSGDFRSNVSLGATAEKVKLTKEQEQIALKTASLSRLPWCAVDIMPLVKGSNKEIGDNAVLEINASPGTDGISDVLGVNFMNILLNELIDSNNFCLQDKIAGFIESVTIEFDDNTEKIFLAKLDTGNSTKASTLEVGDFELKNKTIEFNIDGKTFTFDIIDKLHALAGEEVYERPIICIPKLKLGARQLNNVPLAIVKSRGNKTTNLLINRDVLSKLGYVIHPNNSHILTEEMEKVKII